MTTARTAQLHFTEVVSKLTIAQIDCMEAMTPTARARYVCECWRDMKTQQLKALKAKLKTQRGNEAKQTRMSILQVMREVHE